MSINDGRDPIRRADGSAPGFGPLSSLAVILRLVPISATRATTLMVKEDWTTIRTSHCQVEPEYVAGWKKGILESVKAAPTMSFVCADVTKPSNSAWLKY